MKGGRGHVDQLHMQNIQLIHVGLDSKQENDLMKLGECIKHCM